MFNDKYESDKERQLVEFELKGILQGNKNPNLNLVRNRALYVTTKKGVDIAIRVFNNLLLEFYVSMKNRFSHHRIKFDSYLPKLNEVIINEDQINLEEFHPKYEYKDLRFFTDFEKARKYVCSKDEPKFVKPQEYFKRVYSSLNEEKEAEKMLESIVKGNEDINLEFLKDSCIEHHMEGIDYKEGTAISLYKNGLFEIHYMLDDEKEKIQRIKTLKTYLPNKDIVVVDGEYINNIDYETMNGDFKNRDFKIFRNFKDAVNYYFKDIDYFV